MVPLSIETAPVLSGAPRRGTALLIHGAANGAWVWSRRLPLLAEGGFEAHALDLRGHGKSAGGDLAAVGMDDYLEDVEWMASRLRPAPVVVGWSMGGLLALMYARRRPETPALVLIGPSAPAEVLRRKAGGSEQVAPLYGVEAYGITVEAPEASPAPFDLPPAERRRVATLSNLESGLARQ